MSWAAQEWVWRHSKVLGVPKYIFLSIARRVFKDKAETGPTSLQQIAEITGMSESTVTRCIAKLEAVGDLKVVKADRRGTTHRYQLALQGRLPVDVTEPKEPRGPHPSQRLVSPVTVTSESPPGSPVTETGVSRQPDGCESSLGQVSPVTLTGGFVQPASSKVQVQELTTEVQELRTAAPPRFSDQATEPSPDGNYRVIARLAAELLGQGWWEFKGERFPIESEATLVHALKDECPRLGIDRGNHPDVAFDVIHRAAASEWFKHRNPHVRQARRG